MQTNPHNSGLCRGQVVIEVPVHHGLAHADRQGHRPIDQPGGRECAENPIERELVGRWYRHAAHHGEADGEFLGLLDQLGCIAM